MEHHEGEAGKKKEQVKEEAGAGRSGGGEVGRAERRRGQITGSKKGVGAS